MNPSERPVPSSSRETVSDKGDWARGSGRAPDPTQGACPQSPEGQWEGLPLHPRRALHTGWSSQRHAVLGHLLVCAAGFPTGAWPVGPHGPGPHRCQGCPRRRVVCHPKQGGQSYSLYRGDPEGEGQGTEERCAWAGPQQCRGAAVWPPGVLVWAWQKPQQARGWFSRAVPRKETCACTERGGGLG